MVTQYSPLLWGIIFFALFPISYSSYVHISGTLVEAKGYQVHRSLDPNYEFVGYCQLLANMPAGIKDREGNFYLLALTASDLAPKIYHDIEVWGRMRNKVIVPDSIDFIQ